MSNNVPDHYFYDLEGELASDRAEVIERQAYAIIGDQAKLQAVIDDMIAQCRFDAKIVRVLAGVYVAGMTKGRPEWFSPSLHQREIDQLAQDIAASINSRATEDVDKGREIIHPALTKGFDE